MLRAPLPFTLCLACVVALASPGRSSEDNDLPLAESVEPQMYATGFEFAEGLALDPEGNLYVVGYRGDGNIGRITPDGTASVLCTLDQLLPVEGKQSRVHGLKIDSEGRLIAADAGCGRLLRISADGKVCEVLADRLDGVRFKAIQDVALDLAGNIFFSDPGASSRETPAGAVYRYDINTKKVTRAVADLAFPSGMAISPDQQHLCVSDSLECKVLIYDLAEDGSVSGGRVLYRFDEGSPAGADSGKYQPGGIAFDVHGRLFVAMRLAEGINVIDVERGKLLRQYQAGGRRVTNCHFHGTYLYATIAAKEAVFRLKLGVRGFEYAGP
jgi:gluconolactonase